MDNHSFLFRKAQMSDLETVLTVLDEAAQHVKGQGDYWKAYRKDTPLFEKWAKPRVEDQIGKGNVYVALSGGEIIGTYNLSTEAPPWHQYKGDIVPWKATGKALYLSGIGVRPSYQGKGCATAIIQYVEEDAKEIGCTSVRLDTAQNSVHMRNRAIKLGYTPIHVRDEPEDIVLQRHFLEKVI